MPAKGSTNSSIRAQLERSVVHPVTRIIDDLDSVRAKPTSAPHLMPPWQRIARRKGNAKH